MSYPDYPKNRLIVNGVDLTIRFQMILLDGYTLSPPEPKTYTVDIPGGDGVIDLTYSLTGGVSFKNRQQEFVFMVVNPDSFERVKTDVSNFLHGKSFDYQMTMDPGYTYHGRFTVDEYSHKLYSYPGLVGTFSIKIDADPYKLKKHMTYNLNAAGGKLFRLESGRKPVHPVIECKQPSTVRWKDITIKVPVGTYRLNDVLFTQGYNEIYINSYEVLVTLWRELDKDAEHQITWDEASSKQYRWDDLGRIGAKDYPNEDGDGYDDLNIPRCWNDASKYRWDDLKKKDPHDPFSGKMWDDLDYLCWYGYHDDKEHLPDEAIPEGAAKIIPDFAKVRISYDWKDL